VQHIGLTASAIVIAIVIGVPLGILICRTRKLRGIVLGFVNVVQAVPSMALLGLLVPILGIGSKPAIFAVVVYSLLPIVKNTYIGVTSIDPVVIESATGMGLTRNQTLFKIQIPLALPIIMGGIRISAVTSVGLMTLAAFIGAGGLGYLVFSGVQTVNNSMILAGAIPSCILALLVDYLFSQIEVLVTPKGIDLKKEKKNFIGLKVVTAILAVVIIFTTIVPAFSHKKDTFTVGSKNYTEQLVLGNIYADLVEEYTDMNVVRKLNLGGAAVTTNAIKSGEIDMYPDYTGVLLLNVLNAKMMKDPDETFKYVKKEMAEKYNCAVLDPIGFNDMWTLAVKPELAEKYNLKTYSDLIKVQDELTLACTLEFANREDAYLGIKKMYNLNFGKVKAVDGSFRYTAVANDEAQVLDANSTEGLVKKYKLTILEDDKGFFPPYYAVPVVRQDTLDKYPQLKEVLDKLIGKIDEDTMRTLNYEVDSEGKAPEEVAHKFLKEVGLIK
jgi:osmoprotectant transport system permease protein